MVQERLTEIEHGAGVRPGGRVMAIRLHKVCMYGGKYSKRTRYICLVKGGGGG